GPRHEDVERTEGGEALPRLVRCLGREGPPHRVSHRDLFVLQLEVHRRGVRGGGAPPRRVAQRDLFVRQLGVHRRGSPSTRWAVTFLFTWVVPPAIVSDRVDSRATDHRPPGSWAPSSSWPRAARSCSSSPQTVLARLAEPDAAAAVAAIDRWQST